VSWAVDATARKSTAAITGVATQSIVARQPGAFSRTTSAGSENVTVELRPISEARSSGEFAAPRGGRHVSPGWP
jgi:hypothetical protein